MQKSINSLSDGSYDMVDDVSDLSSDDHDTVSIASTDNIDDDDENSPYDQIAGVLDDMQSLPVHRYEHDTPKPVFDHLLVDETTPQQSIVTVMHSPELSAKSVEDVPTSTAASKAKSPSLSAKLQTLAVAGLLQGVLWLSAVYFVLYVIIPMAYPAATSQDMQVEHEIRQLRLAHSISEISPSQTFNVSHLLPTPVATGKSFLGSNLYRTSEVRYQAVSPSRLVVSLPRVDDSSFPEPTSISITRGDQELNTTVARLIDGVHVIALQQQDAFGLVTVSILCHSPKLAIAITHDFGQPIMHAMRSLAERVVTTDLSTFIDRAAISAQKIEERAKELAVVARDEFVRDLHLSRERAISIVSDLRTFASRSRSTVSP